MALEPAGHDQDFKINLDTDPNAPQQPPTAPQPAKPAPMAQPAPQASQPNTGNAITDFLKTANHPGVCIMHLLFKCLAIVRYFSYKRNYLKLFLA